MWSSPSFLSPYFPLYLFYSLKAHSKILFISYIDQHNNLLFYCLFPSKPPRPHLPSCLLRYYVPPLLCQVLIFFYPPAFPKVTLLVDVAHRSLFKNTKTKFFRVGLKVFHKLTPPHISRQADGCCYIDLNICSLKC